MGTEPQRPTLAELSRRAVELVDADRSELGAAQLEQRLEDRDEPITAIGDVEQLLAEERGRIDPEAEDPALDVVTAVITYLAFRRDQVESEPEELLRLAVRAELGPEPPERVTDWLERRHIPL